MRPRRRSKICDLLVLTTLAAGCGGAPLDTALSIKDVPRRPDGVVVEPPPAIPTAEDHASAQAGVVALRQPISNEQIGEIVHKYVRAFTEGERDSLDDLFDDNAVLFADGGRTQPRAALLQGLRIRYQQHAQEYRAIREDIARLDRIERWSSDDLGPFTDPPRPAEMRRGDVLARVPLDPQMSPSTGEPLFRSSLLLLLRRGPDRVLRIAGLGESDAP